MDRLADRTATLLIAFLLLAGCSSAGTGSSTAAANPWGEGYEGLKIVATVPPIVDLVQQVAGEDAKVVGLVPSGVDSHTYEPSPDDAKVLSQADVFFTPADQATPGVTQFAQENLPEDAATVQLAEAVPPDEFIYNESAEELAAHGHGHDINVHYWTNIRYSAYTANFIAETLSEMDPEGKKSYDDNLSELLDELKALNDATVKAVDTIPAKNRRLVVYHDAWDYFARDYGLEVVGTIQAADLAEPSAAEVGAMSQQIEAANVPAFFGSEVFPSDVLEALAAETGAEYVGDLSDDRLPGEPGDPEHSYVGMMVDNVRLIVESLGGDAAALDAVDPSGA